MEDFCNDKVKRQIAEAVAMASLTMVPVAGPGLAIIYEVFKILMDRAAERKNQGTQKRISAFQQVLLSEENEPISFDDIDINDFTSLVEAMIRDEEDEKADYYSRMFVSITSSGVGRIEKLELLKTIKHLTSHDIEYLRKMYIAQNFNLKGSIPTDKLSDEYSFPRLKSMSLIEDDINKRALRKTGVIFLRFIYSDDELSPNAIGMREWRPIRYTKLSMSIDPSENHKLHARVLDSLSAVLHDFDCQTVEGSFSNTHNADRPLIVSGRILLVHDGTFKPEHTENFSKRLAVNNSIVVCASNDLESDALIHLRNDERVLYLTMPQSPERVPEIANELRDVLESALEFEKAHPNN